LLGHTDPRVADEHYKRTSSLNAGSLLAGLIHAELNY
jgi:hypothetical protein